jgi:hypothetical protein
MHMAVSMTVGVGLTGGVGLTVGMGLTGGVGLSGVVGDGLIVRPEAARAVAARSPRGQLTDGSAGIRASSA